MSSVRKTLKTLVWSAQNRSISCEICPKITTKSAVFLPIAFRPSLPWKFPRNSREIDRFFRDFVPKNPAKFDFFFLELSEALSNWAGFANFIDEWSQSDFCFTNFGVILEYLELSITTKKANFRLFSLWCWCVYTIVRDTQSSCDGPLTRKAQIHNGDHRVNFDRNLPSSCFVMQYNSLTSMI